MANLLHYAHCLLQHFSWKDFASRIAAAVTGRTISMKRRLLNPAIRFIVQCSIFLDIDAPLPYLCTATKK
tara:strand:- start:8176 stop:8385 length:210 start_codon:yes stop_codon:yes gene_type:complete